MGEERRDGRYDRRRSARSGRRESDPSPECPSCGLPVGNRPHGSDEDCVDALRGEVSRLREVLATTKTGE